jgi:hypothetical protein
MSETGLGAERVRRATAKHLGAKPPDGAKQPEAKMVRVQLHLGETVSKRLSVHAALEGRNASRVADEILVGWLRRYGKGREIFKDDPSAQVTDPLEE